MYKTNDIGLVAALACNQIDHREIAMVGSKAYFQYDETEAFEDVSNDYYAGKLFVNALEFALKLKTTKQAMFSQIDRQNVD